MTTDTLRLRTRRRRPDGKPIWEDERGNEYLLTRYIDDQTNSKGPGPVGEYPDLIPPPESLDQS